MTGSISSVVPYAVIDAAARAGATTETLLHTAGLPATNRPGADTHIPASRYIELWDQVLEQVAKPGFALAVATGIELEDNEVFGFLAMSCTTLGEAFERTAKYRALYNTGARWELQIESDATRLIYYPWPIRTRSAGYRAAVELSVADMANAGRKLARETLTPIAVRFAHPAPASLRPYREALGVEPTFGALLDELVYPPGLLGLPIKSSNSRLRDYFDAQCAVLADRFVDDAPTAARARAELIATMNGGDISMEALAKRLGTSARSLHRKLADEGVRFADLLDDVRHEFAKRYLARGTVTASEVAYLTGFQSPNAFFRAFKRWTGQTPKAYQSASSAP
ncbi:MAG TPA: AraC family transcriptional regulator ligand-binding domain-containing protein [Kofleriaceae bacterium]